MVRRFLIIASLFASGALCQDETGSATAFSFERVPEVDRASYEDFAKYLRERNWSRALRSVMTQFDIEPKGFLETADGRVDRFWRIVRDDLLAAGPEARRAFHLFHDARAGRELATAREEPDLALRAVRMRRIVDIWFPTSSGDDAASDLARLEFEGGRPWRAVEFLRAVLDHHPDTNLDREELWIRLAVAQAAAGERQSLETTLSYLQLGGVDRVIPGGVPAGTIGDLARELRERVAAMTVETSDIVPSIGELGSPAWVIRHDVVARPKAKFGNVLFGGLKRLVVGEPEPEEEKKSPRWVPHFFVKNGRLVIADHGMVVAVSATDGRLAWRLGDRSDNLSPATAERNDVLAGDDFVLATRGPTQQGLYDLACIDLDTGRLRWTLSRCAGLAEHGVAGRPLIDGPRVYLPLTRAGSQQLFLAAVETASGRVEWNVELGTPLRESRFPHWWMVEAATSGRALLQSYGEEICVHTDGGALIAVDTSGALKRIVPIEFSTRQASDRPSVSALRRIDQSFVLRGKGNRRLIGVNARDFGVTWSRSVDFDSQLAAVDDLHFYLVGSEINAYARAGRALVWSRKRNAGYVPRPILVTNEGVWLVEMRRLVLVDRMTGDLRRRVALPDEIGVTASLHVDDHRLYVVGAMATACYSLNNAEESNER